MSPAFSGHFSPPEAGLAGVRRTVNRTLQDLPCPLLVFLLPSLILAAVGGPAVPITGGLPPRSRTVSHLGPRCRVQPWSALLCQAYNRASAVPSDVGTVPSILLPGSVPGARWAAGGGGGKPSVELSCSDVLSLHCCFFLLFLNTYI